MNIIIRVVWFPMPLMITNKILLWHNNVGFILRANRNKQTMDKIKWLEIIFGILDYTKIHESYKNLRGNVTFSYPCIGLLKGPRSNPSSSFSRRLRASLSLLWMLPSTVITLLYGSLPKCYFSLNVRPLPVKRCCCYSIWCLQGYW